MSWTPIFLVRVDKNLEKGIEKTEENIERWLEIKEEHREAIKNILDKEKCKLKEINEELEKPLTEKQIEELAEKKTEKERTELEREFNKKREQYKGDLMDILLEIKNDLQKGRFLKIEGKNYLCIYTRYSSEANCLLEFFKQNNITYITIDN